MTIQTPVRRVTVNARAIVVVLVAVDLLVAVPHLVTALDEGREPLLGGGSLLDLDARFGLSASWQLAQLLAAAAIALTAAATSTGRRARGWAALGIGALVIAAEETIQLHARSGGSIRNALSLDGGIGAILAVGAAAAVALAIAWSTADLWRSLPERPRTILFAAGLCYLGGAIVLGGIGTTLWDHGSRGTSHLLVVGAEEVLESIGITLLVHGVLVALAHRPTARLPFRVVDGRRAVTRS